MPDTEVPAPQEVQDQSKAGKPNLIDEKPTLEEDVEQKFTNQAIKNWENKVKRPLTNEETEEALLEADESIKEIHQTGKLIHNLGQERIRAEEARDALQELADHDPLTGLFTRRAFIERVDEVIREFQRDLRNGPARIGSMIVLDLDDFKEVNGTERSLQLGDELLVEVTKKLQGTIRPGTILGRWGGDEFIAYVPEAKPEEALLIANRFKKAIAEAGTVALPKGWRSQTASIGITNGNAISLYDQIQTEAQREQFAKRLNDSQERRSIFEQLKNKADAAQKVAKGNTDERGKHMKNKIGIYIPNPKTKANSVQVIAS